MVLMIDTAAYHDGMAVNYRGIYRFEASFCFSVLLSASSQGAVPVCVKKMGRRKHRPISNISFCAGYNYSY